MLSRLHKNLMNSDCSWRKYIEETSKIFFCVDNMYICMCHWRGGNNLELTHFYFLVNVGMLKIVGGYIE